jgi:thioesterase domain-containing protein
VFPGRLILIRAERTPNWLGSGFNDPLLGWGGLAAGGIEVQTVTADHWNLLQREYVGPLARALGGYLRQ